jgi:protein-disulfide isomerase/uncharacterized membrane protein
MTSKGPRLLALVLAAAGFVVSCVLEVVHAKAYLMPGSDSFCRIGETMDCGVVALSRLSVILGVPLPIWGVAGFLALGIAAHRRSKLLLPLSAIAALVSIGLLIESLTHVGTMCLLCEIVHAIAIAIFGVAVIRRRDFDAPGPVGRQAIDVLVTPAAIVLLAMAFAPRYWQPLTWQQGVPYAHGVTEDGDPWVGAEDPKVTVEEYVDYSCPHCAVGSNRMRMRLARESDELRIVRKHKPRTHCTAKVPSTCTALRAALCAGDQDKFWEMDSWLFVHVPGAAEFDPMEGASAIGLDVAAFTACFEATETFERAAEIRKASAKARVRETPAYVIDGKRIDNDKVGDAIDSAL